MKTSPFPAALLILAAAPAVAAPPTGAITRHVWTGIPGNSVADLSNLTDYPDDPDMETTANSFLAPTDWNDNYGTRMFGWVHAPVSGEYTFAIHSDDNSELWLSTGPSPDDRVQLASVPQHTLEGEYNKFASQTSEPVTLEAGEYYFIEAIQKEGTGGDNLGVAWSYPGQSSLQHIPGNQLSAWQNLAPETQDDRATLSPGGTVTMRLLTNDFDPNGSADLDFSSLTITAQPSEGTVSFNLEKGLVSYTHSGSETGSDSFDYRIQDQSGLTSTATVHLTISDAMRLPLATSQMPQNPPAQEISLVNAFPEIEFNQPLSLSSPPGETNRIFVLEKGGNLTVISDLTSPSKQLFLDLDSLVNLRNGESFQSGGEQGLLGLAFHPNYAENARFFLCYSVNINGIRYHRLSEFLASAGDSAANSADPQSEQILIEMRNEESNHNGGDLHFGPDGYLYMSWGDEGGSNDNRNNSQQIDKDFWSSITRIDVDLEVEDYTQSDGSKGDDGNLPPHNHPAIVLDGSGNPRYEVPADNPWVGASSFNGKSVNPSEVRTEFWAVGLRNPWRMSFDPATGTLWCGDVGQGAREEIDIIVKGGNYEWAFREGFIPGVKWNQRPTNWAGGEPPIYDYERGNGEFQGTSVTGGVVYRGERIPALSGLYLFADYNSGNIWSLDNSGSSPEIVRIAGEGGIVGFGHDPSNGDVLLADIDSGVIRRLTTETRENDFPQTLTATGLFADVETLTPNPGLVSYDVNLAFWSDHAIKSRWFGHPETDPTFLFSEDDNWTLPEGTLWVKHFDLERERGNPETKKRIETRVIVKNNENLYGVSYRWNEEETEATLADAAGEEFDLAITENGEQLTQRWRIPSQASCLTCHSEQAGGALSFRTRQLNLAGKIAGVDGNFLSLLELSGYLENMDKDPKTLARFVTPDEETYSLEARARSWLAVNCSYCHSESGSVPAEWDASADLKLFETGLINGLVVGGVEDPAHRLIVPGNDEHSVIVNRTAARNGYDRMPPLATSVVDEEGVQLLIDWINSELPNRESYAAWRERIFGDSPDGAPDADADSDNRDNRSEYLAKTDPMAVDSAPAPIISPQENNLRVALPDLLGRGQTLESSTDLQTWERWPVTGNDGLDRSAGEPQEFTLPQNEERHFFRSRIEEK